MGGCLRSCSLALRSFISLKSSNGKRARGTFVHKAKSPRNQMWKMEKYIRRTMPSSLPEDGRGGRRPKAQVMKYALSAQQYVIAHMQREPKYSSCTYARCRPSVRPSWLLSCPTSCVGLRKRTRSQTDSSLAMSHTLNYPAFHNESILLGMTRIFVSFVSPLEFFR
jgi:hypothetical protein